VLVQVPVSHAYHWNPIELAVWFEAYARIDIFPVPSFKLIFQVELGGTSACNDTVEPSQSFTPETLDIPSTSIEAPTQAPSKWAVTCKIAELVLVKTVFKGANPPLTGIDTPTVFEPPPEPKLFILSFTAWYQDGPIVSPGLIVCVVTDVILAAYTPAVTMSVVARIESTHFVNRWDIEREKKK
jgi:hypothetical protein